METNVNYAAVGAFVIVLIAAIIFAVIWLSSGFAFTQNATYLIYMKESVSGLTVDSPVEYNGVSVGTVRDIQLDTKNPKWVELTVNIKKDTPLTKGTVATLATRGVTGITFIALKDTGTDLRPLVKAPNRPYPVIPTAPSIFMRLDTALSQLSKNFDKIADGLHTLLSDENQHSIRDTLYNLKLITANMANNGHKLDVILENTSRASRQFSPLMQSSIGAIKMFESQTLPSIYRVMSNLENVTQTLTDVSQELKQNPSMLIRGVDHSALGPGETK